MLNTQEQENIKERTFKEQEKILGILNYKNRGKRYNRRAIRSS